MVPLEAARQNVFLMRTEPEYGIAPRSGSVRASETNKSKILLVFLPAFSVAPKVTYR